MFDRWEQTVTAGIAEADAIKVECKISPGILTDLVIFMPPGCQGLCRCRVFLGEKPIAPRSAKLYVSGEGFVVQLSGMNERIREDRPVLHWYVWNVDETYSHTPWMSAQWLSETEMYERKTFTVLQDFVAIMKRLMGVG